MTAISLIMDESRASSRGLTRGRYLLAANRGHGDNQCSEQINALLSSEVLECLADLISIISIQGSLQAGARLAHLLFCFSGHSQGVT